MKPNPIVLLIDEDKANRRLIRLLLQSHGYRLYETENGLLGLAAARACHPDVIILELALPDMDGLDVLKRLRQFGQTPVLVLSVRNREIDSVVALDGGANDYMTKPFSEAELLARLRVLRRCIPGEFNERVLVEDDLTVDLNNHRVVLNGRRIDLTPTEEGLFHTLAAYAGRVVTSKHLLRSVWGAEGENHRHCLPVFIYNLRKKLEATRGRVVIATVGGLGYRLVLPSGD